MYTSCSLNKGGPHNLKRLCITIKGHQLRHMVVYTGVGDERHCIHCGVDEKEIQQ